MSAIFMITFVLGGLLSAVAFSMLKDWWVHRNDPPKRSETDQKIIDFGQRHGIASLVVDPPEGVTRDEVRKSFYLTYFIEQGLRWHIEKVIEVMDDENASSIAERVKANENAKKALAVLQNYHLGSVGELKDLLKEQLTYLAEDILEATNRITRFNTFNPETKDYE